MKAIPYEPEDIIFQGQVIPKQFVSFARGILPPREMDAVLLDDMICSIPRQDYPIVRDYLDSLVASDLSDADIIKIFWQAGARIIDAGRPQRDVIAEFLSVISARIEGRVSTIPAYPDVRRQP